MSYLQLEGMVTAFKTISKLVHTRKSAGPEISRHPAGVYMAVPQIGEERIFSNSEAAHDYHKRILASR
jgi:hypothetical protein